MARKVWCAGSLVVCVALFASVGCGERKPKPIPVSGTVTLDGQPLPEGVVYFKTIETGALDIFTIQDGKFSGNAQEGERRVEIIAKRMKPAVIDGEKIEVQENYLPPRYHVESTLTATVTPGGPNQFTFELSSK